MVEMVKPITKEEHESALKKGHTAVHYCMHIFFSKVVTKETVNYVQQKLKEWFQMKGRGMFPPRNISFVEGCQRILEYNRKKFASN